jgi:hypothetical protein
MAASGLFSSNSISTPALESVLIADELLGVPGVDDFAEGVDSSGELGESVRDFAGTTGVGELEFS